MSLQNSNSELHETDEDNSRRNGRDDRMTERNETKSIHERRWAPCTSEQKLNPASQEDCRVSSRSFWATPRYWNGLAHVVFTAAPRGLVDQEEQQKFERAHWKYNPSFHRGVCPSLAQLRTSRECARRTPPSVGKKTRPLLIHPLPSDSSAIFCKQPLQKRHR